MPSFRLPITGLWAIFLCRKVSSAVTHFPDSYITHDHHDLNNYLSHDQDQADGLKMHVNLHPQNTAPHSKRGTSIISGFDYGTDKIRGVNIGGWLVTEPWITPSLYDTGNDKIVDEYTFCQYLGRTEATKRLQAHWASFYTEEDFQMIKSYGLNHVRIPVGYWMYDISAGEPFVQGQLEYLQKAVKWAKLSGLKVMIDIHGAPGSQNGFDNSGIRGPINWAVDPSNVERTKNVFRKLAQEFSQPQYAGTVTSLQALNEPAGFANKNTLETAKQYFMDGYEILREVDPPRQTPFNLLYAIHDAFQPLSTWSQFFPSPKKQGVALDTHIYTIFDDAIRLDDDARVAAYCSRAEELTQINSEIITFVGEFSPAPTDCAPHLNGMGRGSRYDGTFEKFDHIGSCEGKSGSSENWSEEYKKSLARFFEVQTTVYEKASGWFMWTFKAESADDWSYDAGVKGGWIPQDPTIKVNENPRQ